MWWWQWTIAARKLILISIGIFGEKLGPMQLHMASLLVLIVILQTANSKPYGSRLGNLFLKLDLGSLFALWLMLWAASIFLDYPKCELTIQTLGYLEQQQEKSVFCELFSVLVGSFLASAFVVLLVAYVAVKLNFQNRCLKRITVIEVVNPLFNVNVDT